MPRERLGEILRETRERHGLSLSQVARQARISKGYLSQLERGKTESPSKEVLDRVSRVLSEGVTQSMTADAPTREATGERQRAITDGLDMSTVAAVASTVVQQIIPPEADRTELLRRVVQDVLDAWTDPSSLAGSWCQHIPRCEAEEAKRDRVEVDVLGSEVHAVITRELPESQQGFQWVFQGQVRGRLLFGMFYPRRPDANALSYGTIQLRKIVGEADESWEGFYVRLNVTTTGQNWEESLRRCDLTWTRSKDTSEASVDEAV